MESSCILGRSPPIQPRFRNFYGNLSSNFPKDFKSLVEVSPISRKDVIRSKNLETPFDAQLTKLAAIGEEVVEQHFIDCYFLIAVLGRAQGAIIQCGLCLCPLQNCSQDCLYLAQLGQSDGRSD
jgi:hypothetical protein